MISGSPKKLDLYKKLKNKAFRLRSKGLSYNDILKKVPVTKSTISIWCRSVTLTPGQKRELKERSRRSGLEGVEAIQTMFWKRRCEAFLEGAVLSRNLRDNGPEFFAGLMLYWAEGTKKSSTAITNSDPRIIKFMVKWLRKFFDVKPEELCIGLHIHPGQNEETIKNYWSNLTGIPFSNFRKVMIKDRGSGYRKNMLENGIAKIIVRKNGSTYVLFRILGAINGFLKMVIEEPIEPKNWLSKLPHARPINLKF